MSETQKAQNIDAAPAAGTRSHDIEPKDDAAAIDTKKASTSSSTRGGQEKTLDAAPKTDTAPIVKGGLDLKDASCEEAKLLVDIVVGEHESVKSTYADYQAESDLDRKLALGRKIVDLVVEHAGKEEIALYPAFRDIPSLGDAEVEQAKKEHLEVTIDLYKLDKMPEANAEYDALLGKIMTELTEHVADEESRLLPTFAKEVDRTKAKDILNAYTGAIVTSRPHPAAPHEGLAAAAAHAMSKPLDAAVDAVRQKKAAKKDE